MPPRDVPAPAAPADHPHAVSRTLRLGALVVAAGGSVATYTAINLMMAQTEITRVLPTFIDDLAPFQPATVVIYLGIYSLALSPVCLLTDRRVLFRGMTAYILLLLAGVPFWLFWPVTVPRSPVPVTDLFTWGVALMRWIDPPANCFPSMHVAETILATLLCWRFDRATGVVVGILAALVWWSTLALDQHWFLDGLFGALLAVGIDALCFRWRPLPAEAFRRLSRWYLAWPAALYVAQFLACAIPYWFDLATPADIGAEAGP
jgi:membrane-associated phospholipid phosphatase